MAYRFRRRESIEQGLQRITREQIRRAVREIRDPARDRHAVVHGIRRRFKKIRALLQLLRVPLGRQYGRENACFRDAGRRVSSIRDAESVREAVVRMTQAPAVGGGTQELGRLQIALAARRQQAEAAGASSLEDRLEQLAVELEVAARRAKEWRLKPADDSVVLAGLEETYARGRQAFRIARMQANSEAWHDWRKRVKAHWYQTRLVVPAWPGVFRARHRELLRLSELLGDEHDLAVLTGLLDGEPVLIDSADEQHICRQQVAARSKAIRRQARSLGKRLYVEKPSAFRQRVACSWNLWRKGR